MLDADAVGRLRIRSDGYRQLASRQIDRIRIDDGGRRCDQQRNTIFCIGYGSRNSADDWSVIDRNDFNELRW